MIKIEIVLFFFIGLFSVGIDFSIYLFIVFFDVIPVSMAKIVGFLAGTLFAYFANRSWTFSDVERMSKSVVRFIIVYLCSLMANVFVNKLFLLLFIDVGFVFQLAFFIATIVSASINFIGMKFFVFTQPLKVEIK
jgi:putative flippase GtrA